MSIDIISEGAETNTDVEITTDIPSENVEKAATDLIEEITNQFKLSARVSAIEINTTAAMNTSTQAFYSALHERLTTLVKSAQQAQRHANAARNFADSMTALLEKAKRLEALIDRLDEYTARQEASLSNDHRLT